MKKLLIISIICYTFCISDIKAQFSVGVKFGANWSSLTGYNVPEGSKAVLNRDNVFGAALDYSLNKNLSLQSEFLYSGKGDAQENSDGTNLTKFNMNYLEIPMLAKYTFGKKTLKSYVIAGPYLAYWINGATEWTDNQSLNEQSYSFANVFLPDNKTVLTNNRLDYGFDLGAGLSYAFGPGNLILDARYEYGLTSYNGYIGSKPANFTSHDNRVLALTAGYMYKLD